MAFDLHPILDKYVSPSPGLWYAVAPDGATPAARVGATAIQAREAGTVFLCAGASPEGAFSDLHELKICSEGVRWRSLPSVSLPPRYEHTLALTPDNHLLAFAGAHEKGPLNDMWTYMYVQDVGEWEACLAESGNIPPARTHHTSTCVWRDKLVVFSGGTTGTNTLDNTVYIFDIASRSWTCPSVSGTPPSPRQGHISAVVGDTLYIHGGMGSQGVVYSDLYTFSLENKSWSRPHPSGPAPPPLAAHGCAVIGTHIYIFGGLTTDGVACDTLHYLDTETQMWSLVEIQGASPPSRLDHAMTTITLPLSPPPESNDDDDDVIITSSPMSQQAQHITGSTVSQLVTVMGPDTVDDLLAIGEKKDAPTAMTFASKDDIVTKTCSEAHKEDDSPKGDNPGNLKRGPLETAELQDSEHSLQKQCNSEVVKGLIIFGGIDTSGHMHNDCFVFVPGT